MFCFARGYHQDRISFINCLSAPITCSSVIRTRKMIHPALKIRRSASLELEFLVSGASGVFDRARFGVTLVGPLVVDVPFFILRGGKLSRGCRMLASNTKGFAKKLRSNKQNTPRFSRPRRCQLSTKISERDQKLWCFRGLQNRSVLRLHK